MASTSDVSEGPVITFLNKRIRKHRKKLRQIEQSNQIENKDKKDLLLAVIEELEKLRLPLTNAIDQEHKNTVPEKTGQDDDVSKKVEVVVEDLLKVIYFGSVFNVKMTRSEFDNMMFTRTHERKCCLTCDMVTNDNNIILKESDLDLLGEMSELLVSRPTDLSLSHKDALRRCVEHAKKWVAGSDEMIAESSSVSYAALRKKLAKIIGSYYYTCDVFGSEVEQKELYQLSEVAARMEKKQSLLSISQDLKIPFSHVRTIAKLCNEIFRQGLKECE